MIIKEDKKNRFEAFFFRKKDLEGEEDSDNEEFASMEGGLFKHEKQKKCKGESLKYRIIKKALNVESNYLMLMISP